LVVDDRTFWSGELIAKEQGLPALLGLDLEKAVLAFCQRLDQVGDLTDDGPLDPLMPSTPGLRTCSMTV
jgi:hypothetical protein